MLNNLNSHTPLEHHQQLADIESDVHSRRFARFKVVQ